MRSDLNRAIRAGFLTQCAGRTFISSVFVTLEDEASTVALCHVERSFTVLGILLRRFVGKEVLEIFLPSNLHTSQERLYSMSEFSEI